MKDCTSERILRLSILKAGERSMRMIIEPYLSAKDWILVLSRRGWIEYFLFKYKTLEALIGM